MPVLRLLSWNIWHLMGDPLAVHRVLRAAAPDLVCLQEAPRVPWSRWHLDRLGRATGLLPVAGGRASAGTAMLRAPGVLVRDPVALRLPPARRRAQPRGAVLASVVVPGSASPVRVASVHLGLDAAERLRHAALLVARLADAHLPVIVAGDLNEPAGGPAWQSFSALATDPAPTAGPTFPTRHPRHRIDAVLTSPSIETLAYADWAPTLRDAALASDHLPVLTHLRL